MRTWILILLSAVLVASAQTQTTQPGGTQPSDRIALLIAQLDDPNFSVRELAEKELSDMGPSIEPQLRDAQRSNISAEARARIDVLLARIQDAMALHAMVTMHYANAPLMKVLTDFARQAGGNLGIDDPSVAKFAAGRVATIDLDNADFWQAMRAVKDASGLWPCIGQFGLTLAPPDGRAGMQVDLSNKHVRSSGGLLIVPLQTREMQTITYEKDQTFGEMVLMLNVIPEPKLRVIGTSMVDWLKDCVDDKGHSLMPTEPNRRFFPGFMMQRGARQPLWSLQTSLREFPGMGSKIARLRGEINLSAQTRSQVFEIEDITRARDATTQDGPASFTVMGCSKINMNYQLTVMIRGITMNDPQYQDFANSAELVDDKGQTIFLQNCIPRPSPQVVNVILAFQPTQNTPVKLRWERTLERKMLTIPFELDDLPLPAVR
ncbi:MAG: hypothetical protein ABSC42_00710 [Tepidisphaeraceae bacterium]|jgi:hypothetical protein